MRKVLKLAKRRRKIKKMISIKMITIVRKLRMTII